MAEGLRRILVLEDDRENRGTTRGFAFEQRLSGRSRGRWRRRAAPRPFQRIRGDDHRSHTAGLDGLIVLRRLREDGIVTPALILSALGGTDDRVHGLRAGGDDYLIKPFAFAELLARVDALARRSETVVKETVLRVGDVLSCTASRSGREIELLPREFYLLEYLVRNDSGAFFIQPPAARHR